MHTQTLIDALSQQCLPLTLPGTLSIFQYLFFIIRNYVSKDVDHILFLNLAGACCLWTEEKQQCGC
jgi:hypothetical protein